MKTKSHPTDQRLDIAILRDVRDFSALEEEWGELYEHCPSATPFQSWGWLYSWWEHYGEDYELRLITLRDDDLLVGLMPLILRRGPFFGRLLFIGTGSTDYLDVLAREGWKQEVGEAAAQALKELDGWRVMDLWNVRSTATVWDIFHGWKGHKAHFCQFGSPIMDVRPWDELLASLSRNHRSTIRRTLRRAEEDGVTCELVCAAKAEEAAARWMALHREAWKRRNIAPEHLDKRFQAYLEGAIRWMTAHELGSISEFRRGDEVIASQFLVFGRNFVGQHLFGATQEALKRYQVSSLYMRDIMNAACARHSVYVDMLQGEEPYKLRWPSRIESNHRLVLGYARLSWALYTGYHALRSKIEHYAYAEHATRWVKKAVSIRLILRRRLVLHHRIWAKTVEGGHHND